MIDLKQIFPLHTFQISKSFGVCLAMLFAFYKKSKSMNKQLKTLTKYSNYFHIFVKSKHFIK